VRLPQRLGKRASTRARITQDQQIDFNVQLVQQVGGGFATLGGQSLIARLVQPLSEPENES
jgi:hypothetical protein